MSQDNDFGGGDIFLAFLLGGIVGAGAMMLLAPESGEDLRKRLKEYSDSTKSKATEFAGQKRDTIVSKVDKGKELYDEKKAAITGAIEAGKEAYLKEKGKLTSQN